MPYVKQQSLTLWEAIIDDMFRLWYLAEQDLIGPESAPYDLKNTGMCMLCHTRTRTRTHTSHITLTCF